MGEPRRPGPYERTAYAVTVPEVATPYGIHIDRLPDWGSAELCLHCDLPAVCVVDEDPLCMGHHIERTGNPQERVEPRRGVALRPPASEEDPL